MSNHVVGSKMLKKILVLLPIALLALMTMSFVPVVNAKSSTPTIVTGWNVRCDNDPYFCPGYIFADMGICTFGGGGTWGTCYATVQPFSPVSAPAQVYYLTITVASWHHALTGYVYCVDLICSSTSTYYIETIYIDAGTTCRWGPSMPYSCDTTSNIGDLGQPYHPGYYQLPVEFEAPPSYTVSTLHYTTYTIWV